VVATSAILILEKSGLKNVEMNKEMIVMTYSDELKCSKCNRVMLLIKGTFLCPVCNIAEIYDLQTPWTTEEEREWVSKNLGVNKNDK
jgi:RNA polymerase subunit RPABC4/transcription elongation factor Spt4